MTDDARSDEAQGSAAGCGGEAVDRHRPERGARSVEERGAPAHHTLARRSDAGRTLRPRRHGGERDRDARGDHSRRGRRRHRVRYARSAPGPAGRPTAGQPAPRARCNRGAGTGRLRAACGAKAQRQTPHPSTGEPGRPGAGANARGGETEEEARRGVAPGARHARRREPLHRTVPRRGGPRVADAAQRQPHPRRGHRRTLHPERTRGGGAAQPATAGSRSGMARRGDRDIRSILGGADRRSGLCAREPARDDRGLPRSARRDAAGASRDRRGDRVSPQLREPGTARRCRRVRHPQGCDQRTGGRTRHRARIDGRALLRRSGTRQCRELRVLRARRRAADEPWRGKAAVHHSRSGGADRRYRVPQGRRCDRRNPGRVQAD